MTRLIRERLRFVIAISLPFGLYGWAIVTAMLCGYDGFIAQQFDGLGTDWMIFYTAARAWFENALPYVYDQVWIKGVVNTTFASHLAVPLDFPAFHYPPHYLLLLLPFGMLSFYAALATFEVWTAGLCLVGLRRMFADHKEFWFFAVAVMVSPAATYSLHQGQNGFMILGLLTLGFALLQRAPWTAGTILGLLALKPQCALMIPVALIAARQWRALTAAIVTEMAFAALSVAVFGIDLWQTWFALFLHPRHDVVLTGIDWGRTWDTSAYTCALFLGTSKSVANILQAAVMGVSAGLVYICYRRSRVRDARSNRQAFCILLVTTVVASPHPSPYDMMPYALAAALYVRDAIQQTTYRPIHVLSPLALWLAPFYNPPIANPVGLVTIPLAFAFLVQIIVQSPALTAAFAIGRRSPIVR